MTYVDANHVLRWFLEDVPGQLRRVRDLLNHAEPATLCLSSVTIAEITYVLRGMTYDHRQVAEVIEGFCAYESVKLPSAIDRAALRIFVETTLDYEDCYLIAQALATGVSIATFDTQLMKIFKTYSNT